MIGSGTLLESLVFMNLIKKIFSLKILPKPYLGYAQPAAQSEVSHPRVPHTTLKEKEKVEKGKETMYDTPKVTRSYRI